MVERTTLTTPARKPFHSRWRKGLPCSHYLWGHCHSLCLCLFPSLSLSPLPLPPSTLLSVSRCHSLCLSVSPSMSLLPSPTSLSVSLSVTVSVCLSVCLSVSLCASVSVCLCRSLSVSLSLPVFSLNFVYPLKNHKVTAIIIRMTRLKIGLIGKFLLSQV